MQWPRIGRETSAGAAAILLLAVLAAGCDSQRTRPDRPRGRAGRVKAEILAERLPRPLAGASAIASGGSVYLFGGDTGSALTDAIVRFDAARGVASVLDARLPEPCKIASAAFDGSRVFLFGGFTAAGLSDRITAFDPRSGEVEVLPARLPSPRGRTAAFFDGRHTYVLGGNLGSFRPTGYLDEIVRFDPATGTVERLPVRLPVPIANRIGVVFVGGSAYLPGGMVAGGKSDRIVRFTPGGGVSTMNARLPFHGDGGAFALLGGRVYVLGGMTTEEPVIDRVLVFRPDRDALEDAGVRLPSPRKGTAAATVGDSIYLFGGRDENGVLDQIVRLTVEGPGS